MRKYSWVPDIPDQRDFLYSKIAKPVARPPMTDLRAYCSPIDDQLQYGSCVLNAETSAVEFDILKSGGKLLELSRFFVYYNCRAAQGDIRTDSGTSMRMGTKMLAKYGVCPEPSWSYIPGHFAKKPTAACYTQALPHKITSYHRLITLDDMLNCLAEGFPFVFGFTVYDSFESDVVAKTGVVNLPLPGEKTLGGHGVMAVGYIDADNRFIVRNSWGTGWGQSGYFTMPYTYLTNTNLADDFWTIRK